MKVTVIGAGNVGTGFAKAAVKAGHEVTITASSAATAAKAATDTGATAGAANADAVADADLVLLAVPASALAAVAAEISRAVEGTTVIDATNPLNATYSDLAIVTTSGAADLQSLLPGASVVKAFNTVLASRYAKPSEAGTKLQVLIAGDDTDAKAKVAELATSIGFSPIDAGGLRLARSLEEMAFLNISLNVANSWSWQNAWALVGEPAA